MTFDAQQYRDALLALRKLLDANPKDVRLALKIGDLHLKLDEHEQALAAYALAGAYYRSEGFSIKAIAVYKQIVGIIQRFRPDLATPFAWVARRLDELNVELGLVQRPSDDGTSGHARAIQRPEGAVASEQEAQVHYDLGFAYAEMDLLSDARQELEIAVALDPENGEAGRAVTLLERLRRRGGGSAQQPPPTIH
jgi:tetratricopeptide (TPR) repeat protein